MNRETILIADDDTNFREALGIRLRHAGYQTSACRDGLGVIARVKSENFSAIVLDQDMPLGAGMDVAGLIRERTQTPIIFVSGHDPEAFRPRCRELGDAFVISKPLDFERLRELLLMVIDAQPTLAC